MDISEHSDPNPWVSRVDPRWRGQWPDSFPEHIGAQGVDYSPREDFDSSTVYEMTPGSHPEVWGRLELGGDAPERLWGRGDWAALTRRPAIAIVGSRAATAYGIRVAQQLACDLAATGNPIVSTSAYGIDGKVITSTIAVGGTPIMVVAGGLDARYPSGNADLFDVVPAAGGLLLSEDAPGENPTRYGFLRRARLIAAAAAAVVVVEASVRGGSMTVAAHAMSLGRALCAVPGSIESAASTGTHQLIRSGATLVTSAADVREVLA